MNFNLNKFVEDVARDNELCREFSKFEEMDEIYGYCKDMGIECSEDEFDESVSKYIYSLDNSDYKMGKIDDDNLDGVAGGSLKGTFSKTLAVALSALTLGGSGFFGNANAGEISKISNFANSSYKTEKVNSGKWSRTKKAMSNFYNNHKKAIIGIGTGVTLGAAVIAGGILYNNHKVNNYKKELSSMSDKDILEKSDKILSQDTRKVPSEDLKKKEKDKDLISSSQNETPKTVEEKSIETPKKTDISSIDTNSADNTKMSKSDKSEQNTAAPSKQEKASSASSESVVDKKRPSIDVKMNKSDKSEQNTAALSKQEKASSASSESVVDKKRPSIDTKMNKSEQNTAALSKQEKASSASSESAVDKKRPSTDANSAYDTKMNKSEQNTAAPLKQGETLNTSDESKKSEGTAIIGKEPEKPDTNHANHETEEKRVSSTADGTPKSSDKVEEESKIDQTLKGANVQKRLGTFERARRPHKTGKYKPSEIGKNIKARSETDDPPKEIAESNDTTQERESPVYGLGMTPKIDLSGLKKAVSNLKPVDKKPLTK